MLKTKKSISKRVKITKSGKILKKPKKQNHYLSKLTGRQKQGKRRLSSFSEADSKKISQYLPNN